MLSLFLLSLDISDKFTWKLSKYSVVNPQLIHRGKRNTNSEVGFESNFAIFSHIFYCDAIFVFTQIRNMERRQYRLDLQ